MRSLIFCICLSIAGLGNAIEQKLYKQHGDYKIFYSAIHQSDLFSEIKNLNLSFENQVVIEKQKQ